MAYHVRCLWRKPTTRLIPGLLALLALLHAALYAWLVPPWQTPDEPAQFEYAALISRLGVHNRTHAVVYAMRAGII